MRGRSATIQGPFRGRSGAVHGHSWAVQGSFKGCSATIHGQFRGRSATIQGPFTVIQGLFKTVQGLFGDHSGSVHRPFRGRSGCPSCSHHQPAAPRLAFVAGVPASSALLYDVNRAHIRVRARWLVGTAGACVHACVRACVRACVQAGGAGNGVCVCLHAGVGGWLKARLDDSGIAPCRSSSHPIPCMCMCMCMAWHVICMACLFCFGG